MRKVATFLLAAALLLALCGCALVRQRAPSAPPTLEPQSTGRLTAPEAPTADETEPTTDEAEPSLAALRARIRQSGERVGIAFLGYVTGPIPDSELAVFLEAEGHTERFPFLSDAARFLTEGQEVYALVPPDAQSVLTVYRAELSPEGTYSVDQSSPLFVGAPGEPVVLLCNLSEIYANVWVTVTDGDGEYSFSPMLTLENGHVADGIGYDFSVYDTEPGA